MSWMNFKAEFSKHYTESRKVQAERAALPRAIFLELTARQWMGTAFATIVAIGMGMELALSPEQRMERDRQRAVQTELRDREGRAKDPVGYCLRDVDREIAEINDGLSKSELQTGVRMGRVDRVAFMDRVLRCKGYN